MKKGWLATYTIMFFLFLAWQYRSTLFEIFDSAIAKNASLTKGHDKSD